jgi:hypothetical protein
VVKLTVLCAQDIADISLDVPAAYLVLERWVIRCRQVCHPDPNFSIPDPGSTRFGIWIGIKEFKYFKP